jgi:hypothetical protein
VEGGLPYVLVHACHADLHAGPQGHRRPMGASLLPGGWDCLVVVLAGLNSHPPAIAAGSRGARSHSGTSRVWGMEHLD